MADYVAAYDDITTQLAQAQREFAAIDTAHRTASDKRTTASQRIQHLEAVQLGLSQLEEVAPVLAKRALQAVPEPAPAIDS